MISNFFILFFLIIGLDCNLPDDKRQELLERLTRKLDQNDNDNELDEDENQDNNINYNITMINEILEKYNFPKNFDFLTNNSITPKIKNQRDCGSCWAFASTSALAYRFKKKYDIEVNLSPQDGVSCYLKDCNAGNFGIDAQLNLMRNGTLTEECFPFTMESPESYMPVCPTECVNNSIEFKRYYSQNVYSTQDILHEKYEKNFYDFVTIIIDQLLTKGPVVTNIDVYTDFLEYTQNGYRCKNDAYSPSDSAENRKEAHAMVIVGYGFLENKNKFYWLIQNSWGSDSCLDGFLRIEFGKANVEKVTFSDPYLSDKNGKKRTNIDVSFLNFDEECNLYIQIDDDSLEGNYEWNNTLEIRFKHTVTNKNFNFYCSGLNFPQEHKVKCFFEVLNYYKPKGEYVFDSWKTIGKELYFSLDDNFEGQKFLYYGYDEIGSYYDEYCENFYISEAGAKLVFYFTSMSDTDVIPNIYTNYSTVHSMEKCQNVLMNDYEDGFFNFIVCDVQNDEMKYFSQYDPENENSFDSLMFFQIYCHEVLDAYTYTNLIDKNEYPVLKISEVYYESDSKLIRGKPLIVYVENIGNIEYTSSDVFSFFAFIYFTSETSEVGYYTEQIYCDFLLNEKNKVKYKSECFVYFNKGDNAQFKELYLLPYFLPYEFPTAFEVRLNDKMEVKLYKEEEQINDSNNNINNASSYNKIFLSLAFLILVLLF